MSTKTMTTLASFENSATKNLLAHSEVERYQPSYFKHKRGRSSSDYDYSFNAKNLAKDVATTTGQVERSTMSTTSAATTNLQKLQKSHSYSETLRPKATVNRQESLSERFAISSNVDKSDNNSYVDVDDASLNTTSAYNTQRDAATTKYNNNYNKNSDYYDDFDDDDSVNTNASDGLAHDEDEEDSANIFGANYLDDMNEDTRLLIPADSRSLTSTASSSTAATTAVSPLRRAALANNLRYSNNSRQSACYRLHTFVKRNWYLNYLIPISILGALMLVAYLTRDYARQLLFWIETQNPWIIFAVFIVLFIIVSFPIVVGYFVLMITSGYLFGFFKGLSTVILGANVGIALAHLCIRSMRHRIPMHRLIKNETGRAILRVISGPRAFRVVIFTRLTPIPFGLQNAIFGVSSINPRVYHAATFLGLLPAQTINVYLGSTLRSMHEVLNSHGTAVTGYISFGIEVICGVALMFWVVQKARKELSETLLDCSSSESKIINIQV